MSPYYYEFSYALEEVGLVLIPALLSGIPTGLFRIAAYVLSSLALYTVARRRCINHPWLAWVPVANLWLLGSLSDQYRYVVKGQIRSRRKLLVFLKVISVGLTVSVAAMVIAVVAKSTTGAHYGMRGDEIFESVMGSLLVTAGIALPLLGVNIAAAVVRYMALYDIYTSCDPDNNVLFTVLGILFRFTEPFFLFFSRNKDQGMPPRREETTPPPQSTWDNTEYL